MLESNQEDRPTASEIEELIKLFRHDKEINKQFEEAERYRIADFSSINDQSTIHPQAYYTSRLLNPFTKYLSKYDNIDNNTLEVIDFTKLSINDENKLLEE
ncbi:hypothetical protein RclHR1_03730006 [Rhizophagus clarus]|nr:hypothetical protein RclHR1_03730006 [Rhizophagus clarus]